MSAHKKLKKVQYKNTSIYIEKKNREHKFFHMYYLNILLKKIIHSLSKTFFQLICDQTKL